MTVTGYANEHGLGFGSGLLCFFLMIFPTFRPSNRKQLFAALNFLRAVVFGDALCPSSEGLCGAIHDSNRLAFIVLGNSWFSSSSLTKAQDDEYLRSAVVACSSSSAKKVSMSAYCPYPAPLYTPIIIFLSRSLGLLGLAHLSTLLHMRLCDTSSIFNLSILFCYAHYLCPSVFICG